jgi:hypothetical protein
MEEAALPDSFQMLDYALLPGFYLAPGNNISSPDVGCGPVPTFSAPSFPNLGISSPNLADHRDPEAG